MEKLLIFSQSVTGHYLEYLHHLYCEAARHPDKQIVIIAPLLFEERRSLLEWPEANNIAFDLQPDSELSYKGHWLANSFRFNRVLRRCIKKHQPDHVFVLAFMLLMPFLLFALPHNTKASGILYELYIYRWRKLSFIRRYYKALLHWLLVKSQQTERIFLLNDMIAPLYYNKLFHTDKFCYLPDPVVSKEYTRLDMRQGHDIPENEKIYLHFGSMGHKKGTLLILETLANGNLTDWHGKTFVFIGVIPDDIKEDFQRLLQNAQYKARILVFSGFCPYDDLCNWCEAADCILVPYLETYNSSGCIGYAARFGVPVIATGTGLLGKLVRHYKLGLTISKPTIKYLRHAILNEKLQPPSKVYSKENTPKRFSETVFQ